MGGQRKRTEQEKAEITPQKKAGLTLQEADSSTPQKASAHAPQKTSDQVSQAAARMLQEELPHLQEIQKILREQLDTADALLEKSQRDIISQKKYLWENFYELDPKEILSNRTSITEEHSLHEMRLAQKRMLLKLQENPYFGRIDFAYD
ncbi:MAG: hypothetical protein K2N94_08690, partial [Lachnospiraceae bacterium]|nr:hypothetical protein [Lachnospiraceae bacterium]